MTVFSTVLVIIGCFFLVVLIRYRLKHRKYETILSSTKDSSKKNKYAPGKTAAYFNGSYTDTVPLTYPSTLQAGTPVLFPPFKKGSYSTGNSRVMSKGRTIKYTLGEGSGIYGSTTPPQHTMNRCASLDDQLFRKSFSIKQVDFKTRESPLVRGGEIESRVSSRNSFGSTSGGGVETNFVDCGKTSGFVSLESQQNSGYESPPSLSLEQASRASTSVTIANAGTYYSHSEFFSDDDSSSLNPSTCTDTENVVSYDQEPDYKTTVRSQHQGPAFLNFQLQYHASVPELVVVVKNAFDLQPTVDVTSNEVNSYVNLCLVPEDFLWKRTRVVENDSDPVYEETFRIHDVLYHKLREYTLCLFVMDSHPLLGERPIGRIVYPLSELRADQAVDVCQELSPP